MATSTPKPADQNPQRPPSGPTQTTAGPTAASDPPADTRRDLVPDLAAGMAGAVAGAAGIAVAELLAGLIGGAPSLIIAMGDLIIRLQPPGAKDFMTNLFGTNDKLALNVAIIVVAVLLASLIGIVARRRWDWAIGAYVVLAVILGYAALSEPLTSPIFAILTPVIAFAVSTQSLQPLLRMIAPVSPLADDDEERAVIRRTPPKGGTARAGSRAAQRGVPVRRPKIKPVAEMPDWNRRRFLLTSAGLAVGSLAAGAIGRVLLNQQPNVPTSSNPVSLPETAASLPPLTANESFDIPGITPIVMPNDQFYRIDTALVVPRVDVATWKLTITGMVDKPLTFTYDSLKALGLFEQYVTLQCVSNHVGENLVGNAKWTGVHLRDVLSGAGVQAGATQIVGRSVDGFTVGFPTEWAMDPQRDPMVVIGMNDALLPAEHGYPARLIVPGLYGYVSATKWLSNIELTTLEAFDAYWVPLGWAKLGPILTQSRIDVPKQSQTLNAGQITVAGVAWAPDRGIQGVQVSIDHGAWQDATISAAISKATWVQWEWHWNAEKGGHRVEVRAIDGTGTIQTDQITDPAPDGARGHHYVNVLVQ
jgi:DMSO/TMAO reductase YedYZ molybdopterin-dependent catalytic subunit